MQPSACSCQICCLIYFIFELCFHASANIIFWLMPVCYFGWGQAIFFPFVCCYCYMLNPETGGEPRGNPCTCIGTSHELHTSSYWGPCSCEETMLPTAPPWHPNDSIFVVINECCANMSEVEQKRVWVKIHQHSGIFLNPFWSKIVHELLPPKTTSEFRWHFADFKCSFISLIPYNLVLSPLFITQMLMQKTFGNKTEQFKLVQTNYP